MGLFDFFKKKLCNFINNIINSTQKIQTGLLLYKNDSVIVNDLYESYKVLLEEILNSNFEEWYLENTDKTFEDFTFTFEKMAVYLREHEKQQRLLAYRDSLTGLRNTNSYWAWITDFDKEIETGEIDFGVLVFDINYLKETNDRYGHDVGNKLIVSAAHIISSIFKRSPVFRIGGDEFAVILQNRDLDEMEELFMKFDEVCRNKSIETEKRLRYSYVSSKIL